MQSQSGLQTKVDFLGIFGEGVGFSQSQSTTNQSTSGIQVSHFRTTVVTADNQKAVGRAYPTRRHLRDSGESLFAASRRADGTILYSLQAIEQVMAIPAWKLLRPDNGPIASAVPADVRERLLQLDHVQSQLVLSRQWRRPCLGCKSIRRSQRRQSRRAHRPLVARDWDRAQLYPRRQSTAILANASEIMFSSTVSINASVGVNYDDISAALSLSSSNITSVGYQTSKETDASESTTASCFLMHNQNERDLDGIEIYYDKIFSTFMFRRVLARTRTGGLCGGVVTGSVVGVDGQPLKQMTIHLRDSNRVVHGTITGQQGEYAFLNLCGGN
jgi:hypothetical protein